MRTPEQREGLQNMIDWLNTIRPTSEMRMIEIGSYVGESTLMFANHFKEVVSVDPYINDYDLSDLACSYAPFDVVPITSKQIVLKPGSVIFTFEPITTGNNNGLSTAKGEPLIGGQGPIKYLKLLIVLVGVLVTVGVAVLVGVLVTVGVFVGVVVTVGVFVGVGVTG